MKKKVITTLKMIAVFSLVLVISMGVTVAFAADEAIPKEICMSELDNDTIIMYDFETQEVTYEVTQENETTDEGLTTDIIVNENGELISTCGIINGESRIKVSDTTDSPYRNVCYVEVVYPDGKRYRASGTLVYFNMLLTAGHVIYNHEHGGYATEVNVYPAIYTKSNGEIVWPFGKTTATKRTAIPAGWINNKNYEYDWAVIDLSSGFDTWQYCGYYADYKQQEGTSISVIGYPKSLDYDMYYEHGTVKSASQRQLQTLCDMEEGQSGGAIIDLNTGVLIGVVTGEYKNIVGINTYNVAVRMDETLYNYIKNHRQELAVN